MIKMDENHIDPLCIIVVKSGAQGGKLLFKYPFLLSTDEGFEEELNRNNPYALRISEDILNHRENEPTNIKDGRLFGFTDEILANMFAVPKELCASKFELKVNDVRFVGHPVSLEPCKDEDGHWTSPLTMFHIVFALKAVTNYSIVQCYHELSQRIGLILKHEERRIGYLNQQTKCLISAMDEVGSLPEDQQEHPFSLAVERSNLAKDIKTIYESLCRQGEIRLYINKWVELSFCLPQKLHKTHFPNIIVEPESIFQCLEALRPYHTLLFLVDENEFLESLSTDASPALRRLVRHSSPLKPFRTLAVDTDLSLMQVFQLTGHLLYWGKATVIYPICESNVYVLSPNLPIPLPLHLKTRFEDQFLGESLLERLVSFSLPCGLQISPPLSINQQRITETITWLLRHHLIVQLHTYVTLALTPGMEWNSRTQELERQEVEPPATPTPSHLLVANQISLPASMSMGSLSQGDSETGSLPGDSQNDGPVLPSAGPPPGLVPATSLPASADKSVELEGSESSGQDKEQRQEELLREFTVEERKALMAVPAASSLQELERFIHLCRYFRGQHHLEEIMYHENMRRSSLLHLIDMFRDVLMKHEHEDPAISRYFRGMQQTS